MHLCAHGAFVHVFISYCTTFCYFQDSDEEDRKEKEKQERIEASLRERKEEVQRSLSTSLRERDKEREQHRKDEAIQHFNALLADLVSYLLLCQHGALWFMLLKVIFSMLG